MSFVNTCCIMTLIMGYIIMPVSYTHLDVYKRQALATAISQFVSALLCMVHLLRVEEEYRLELREIRFDSSMLKQIIQNGVPVSYTPLDVYKRQTRRLF